MRRLAILAPIVLAACASPPPSATVQTAAPVVAADPVKPAERSVNCNELMQKLQTYAPSLQSSAAREMRAAPNSAMATIVTADIYLRQWIRSNCK